MELKYLVISILIHMAVLIPFTFKELEIKKSLPIRVNLSVYEQVGDSLIDKSSEKIKKVKKKSKTAKNKSFKKKIDYLKKNPKILVNKKDKLKTLEDVDLKKIMSKEKLVDKKNLDHQMKKGSNSLKLFNNIYIVEKENSRVNLFFITKKQPLYPKMAKKVGFNKEIIVKTRVLIGKDGNVKDVKILEGYEKLGFNRAVIDAIKTWKLKPIYYNDKNIELYLLNDFKFELNDR